MISSLPKFCKTALTWLLLFALGYWSLLKKESQHVKAKIKASEEITEHMSHLKTTYYLLPPKRSDKESHPRPLSGVRHLACDRWWYLPEKQHSHFEQLLIQWNSADQSIWTLTAFQATAHHATLDAEPDEINASGTVRIKHHDEKGRWLGEVSAPRMRYLPIKQRLETEDAVQMKKPGLLIHGKGAIASFKTGQVQILSDVETQIPY